VAFVLCQLRDLEATNAKEIVLEREDGRLSVFIVRVGERVAGYVNSCPHARLPLNWRPDAFFDISGTFLFCASHGAHFEPATGKCIRGPCKGQSLTPYPVRIEGDSIVAEHIL
jgi:nitrite reductase/ring-hydroxylating ferredoxin subunit